MPCGGSLASVCLQQNRRSLRTPCAALELHGKCGFFCPDRHERGQCHRLLWADQGGCPRVCTDDANFRICCTQQSKTHLQGIGIRHAAPIIRFDPSARWNRRLNLITTCGHGENETSASFPGIAEVGPGSRQVEFTLLGTEKAIAGAAFPCHGDCSGDRPAELKSKPLAFVGSHAPESLQAFRRPGPCGVVAGVARAIGVGDSQEAGRLRGQKQSFRSTVQN